MQKARADRELSISGQALSKRTLFPQALQYVVRHGTSYFAPLEALRRSLSNYLLACLEMDKPGDYLTKHHVAVSRTTMPYIVEENRPPPDDSQRALWEAKHRQYQGKDWITQPTIFAGQVLRYLPQSAALLELGAGQGQDSIYFAEQCHHVTATDFAIQALGIAEQRCSSAARSRLTLKEIDLSTPLPFAPNSFDVVYSHLALHYFDDARTQALFDEILGLLRPQGILAILLNSTGDPEISSMRKRSDSLYETPVGMLKRYFSVETLAPFVRAYAPLLFDSHGQTHKDPHSDLVRFVGRKG